MRAYEILKEHPDFPDKLAGDEVQMNDYPKECALVESGYLKSLNRHSAEGEI
jgi:hypothetical protein